MPRKTRHERRSPQQNALPDYMEADAPVTRVGPKRRRRVSGHKKPKPVPKDDVDEVDDKPTSKRLSLGVQGWMDVDTTPSWDAVFFYWARRVLLVAFFGCVTHTVLWLISMAVAESSTSDLDPLHSILFDAPILFVLAYATIVLGASSFVLCLFLNPSLRLSSKPTTDKATAKKKKRRKDKDHRLRTPTKGGRRLRDEQNRKKNTPPNARRLAAMAAASTPPLPPPPTSTTRENSPLASPKDDSDDDHHQPTPSSRSEKSKSRSPLAPRDSPFDLPVPSPSPHDEPFPPPDESCHSSDAADIEPEEEDAQPETRPKITYTPAQLLAIRDRMIATDWQSSGRAVYNVRDHIDPPVPEAEHDDGHSSSRSDATYKSARDSLTIRTNNLAPPGFESDTRSYASAQPTSGYSMSEYSAGSASDASLSGSGRSRAGRFGPNKSTVGIRRQEGRRSMRGPNPMRHHSRYRQYQQHQRSHSFGPQQQQQPQQPQQRANSFGPRRSSHRYRSDSLRLNTRFGGAHSPPPASPTSPRSPGGTGSRRFFSDSESDKDLEQLGRGDSGLSSAGREHGFIVFMPTEKYGFIRPGNSRSADDIFFHATEVTNPPISVGDEVEFLVTRPQWSNKPLGTHIRILRRGKSSIVAHHRRMADFGRSSHYNPHHYSPPPSPAGTSFGGSSRPPPSPDRPRPRRISGSSENDVSPGTFRRGLRANRGHSQYFSRFSYPR